MAIFPTISVITVCYNSASTIENTLKSVIEQDYPLIEHVVIDGLSSDGTKEIIDRYSLKLAHVVSESDDGIYDAMNKGLNCVSGDIICFLNSDDCYASSNVLSQVALKMYQNNLDVLTGDVGFVKKSGSTKIIRRYRSNRFSPEKISWGWMPAHPALFLRNHVVQRVGLFNTSYRIAGDFEYIARIFYGHCIRYEHINEILVLMQTGGVSSNKWSAKFQLNKEVLRACTENGISTNVFKILSKYPAKFMEYLKL
jgi:glycosyltransferase involved in cell wall biosynthesis